MSLVQQPAQAVETTQRRGLLLIGSGDEDDQQFLHALKGLVDAAVKMLATDKGVGTRIVSGLLRKTGIVGVSAHVYRTDAFISSVILDVAVFPCS